MPLKQIFSVAEARTFKNLRLPGEWLRRNADCNADCLFSQTIGLNWLIGRSHLNNPRFSIKVVPLFQPEI